MSPGSYRCRGLFITEKKNKKKGKLLRGLLRAKFSGGFQIRQETTWETTCGKRKWFRSRHLWRMNRSGFFSNTLTRYVPVVVCLFVFFFYIGVSRKHPVLGERDFKAIFALLACESIPWRTNEETKIDKESAVALTDELQRGRRSLKVVLARAFYCFWQWLHRWHAGDLGKPWLRIGTA